MKKLVIINGNMGVGKTATCLQIHRELPASMWLDGDWCWMINPFVANEENRRMVEDNIIHMLRAFVSNSSSQYVLFSWVMHREEISERIIAALSDLEFELVRITLMCSDDSLRNRFAAGIENGSRSRDGLNLSIERNSMYSYMSTTKIDNSELSVSETANKILAILLPNEDASARSPG